MSDKLNGMVRPSRLREGDVVAVISPSWGGPSVFPHVFDLGLRNLETLLGVRVKEFPTARMANESLYRNPRVRAEDINAAFADSEVRAIVASIGGDDSVRILPYLDLPLIASNPKILLGFSDTTTLTTWLSRQGLVTFNGPSIMAGFAQMRQLPEDAIAHLRHVLMEPERPVEYRPFESWSDRYLDWSRPDYDGELEPARPQGGWRWLQGTDPVRGRLFGGCIEVLEFIKATPFWPDPSFWSERILFLETSEDKPTVDQVVYMLRNYGSMGALERLSAILFGRARSYSDEEKERLYEALIRVVAVEFGRPDLPVVANLDFGHTEPQFVLPLGVQAEVDPQRKRFRLLEAPTV